MFGLKKPKRVEVMLVELEELDDIAAPEGKSAMKMTSKVRSFIRESKVTQESLANLLEKTAAELRVSAAKTEQD